MQKLAPKKMSTCQDWPPFVLSWDELETVLWLPKVPTALLPKDPTVLPPKAPTELLPKAPAVLLPKVPALLLPKDPTGQLPKDVLLLLLVVFRKACTVNVR